KQSRKRSSVFRTNLDNLTNVCPEICPALGAAIEITQPVVDFFGSDSGDRAFPKVCAETRQTLFQIGNVRRAHPILALRFQHFFRQLPDSDVAPADSLQVNPGKRVPASSMVLPCLASFLRASTIAESSPAGRPIASRPWRSRVVIWRSRSASASALVLKNFRPRLKGRRSRYQGCVWLWRYSRTLRVGRFMVANIRGSGLRMST